MAQAKETASDFKEHVQLLLAQAKETAGPDVGPTRWAALGRDKSRIIAPGGHRVAPAQTRSRKPAQLTRDARIARFIAWVEDIEEMQRDLRGDTSSLAESYPYDRKMQSQAKRLPELIATSVDKLEQNKSHKGQVLYCRSVVRCAHVKNLVTLIEDTGGQLLTLQVDNIPGMKTIWAAQAWLPEESALAILEPFCQMHFDVSLGIRSLGIRVDDPMDIIFGVSDELYYITLADVCKQSTSRIGAAVSSNDFFAASTANAVPADQFYPFYPGRTIDEASADHSVPRLSGRPSPEGFSMSSLVTSRSTRKAMATIPYITSIELTNNFPGQEEFVIIDVRDEDRYDGWISESRHYPSASFAMQVALLAAEVKDTPVTLVFHCMYSQSRGPKCARILSDYLDQSGEPYKCRIKILKGGFAEFEEIFPSRVVYTEEGSEEPKNRDVHTEPFSTNSRDVMAIMLLQMKEQAWARKRFDEITTSRGRDLETRTEALIAHEVDFRQHERRLAEQHTNLLNEIAKLKNDDDALIRLYQCEQQRQAEDFKAELLRSCKENEAELASIQSQFIEATRQCEQRYSALLERKRLADAAFKELLGARETEVHRLQQEMRDKEHAISSEQVCLERQAEQLTRMQADVAERRRILEEQDQQLRRRMDAQQRFADDGTLSLFSLFELLGTQRHGPRKVRLQDVRSSQYSVSPVFSDGRSTEYATKQLLSGEMRLADFPTIRVVELDGVIWSLDNRRLRCMQTAFEKQVDTMIDVIVESLKNEQIRNEFHRKFTTCEEVVW